MGEVFVVGHQTAKADLLRAVRSGRIPQVLLLTGDQGIGKQTLGRWLGQVLLCSAGPAAAPCGTCQGCRFVAELTHPDFHWFIPIPRPKAADADKQMDEAAESIGAAVAARRANPVYGPPAGLEFHGVASARLLLKTASLTTVLGGRRVILLGDADRLVPQESSQEAANALLKFLEEPPANAVVMLTTTDVSRVLPTIRSRAVPIRLGRLSEREIEAGLERLAPTLDPAERRRRAAAAEGSLGRALNPGGESGADAQVEQLLTAIKQGGAAPYEMALRQGAFQARGAFSDMLERLAETFSTALRGGTAARPMSAVLRDIAPPTRFLDALDKVGAAKEAALGNVNPQLLLATLTTEIGEALWH